MLIAFRAWSLTFTILLAVTLLAGCGQDKSVQKGKDDSIKHIETKVTEQNTPLTGAPKPKQDTKTSKK